MATTPVKVTPSGDPTYDSLRQSVNDIQARIIDATAALSAIQTQQGAINDLQSKLNATYNTNNWFWSDGTIRKGDATDRDTAIQTVAQYNSNLAAAQSLLNDPTTGLNVQLSNAVAAVANYEQNNPAALSAANAASTSAWGTTTIAIIIVVAVVIIAGVFTFFHFRKKA